MAESLVTFVRNTQADRPADAAAQFEAVIARFDSVQARGEYALWALKAGHVETAARELAALDARRKHMNRHTREVYGELFRALDTARVQVKA